MKTDNLNAGQLAFPDVQEPSSHQPAAGTSSTAVLHADDRYTSTNQSERVSLDQRAAAALYAQVRKTTSAPLPQGRQPGLAETSTGFESLELEQQLDTHDTISMMGSHFSQQSFRIQEFFSESSASPAPLSRREALLGEFMAARERPLDMDGALAAIKLRRAAEIYCPKSNLAKFMPRLPKTDGARVRLQDLQAMPVDQLIADVQANPHAYSRTLLTDVASAHMTAALNIDLAQYRQGIHQAALYEGLHTMAGRVVNLAAAAVSLGVSEIPGIEAALKTLGKAVKVLSHELPPNVVNPLLTGKLRTVTDVKESFKRVGGQPVVMPQIEGSPNMGTIVSRARAMRAEIDDAVRNFTRGSDIPMVAQEALVRLVDTFLALHEVVDRDYRRRIGLNRTQTYSKSWGMAVNGVGVTGAVLSISVPVAGQIIGPAIIGATIPLQWAAGYLDERRNKHRYNLRANMKWGDFLRPEAGKLHFMELRPEHVSESALRQSFMLQSEVQIAAVREVYEDAAGDMVRTYLKLQDKIAVAEETGMPAHMLQPMHAESADLLEQITLTKQQADDFESFDEDRWRNIPADSLIGKCLDDLKALEKADRHARLRKPGESAQIVQRYVQAFHGGVSTGTSMPIIDAISSIDTLHTTVDMSHPYGGPLEHAPQAVAITAGVTGGAVFTAATAEVRMGKIENKKTLAGQLPVSEKAPRANDPQWVFEAANRSVDLRKTAGYRQYAYTLKDEFKLLGKAVKHGLTSGPVGLVNMLRAKGGPQGDGEIKLSRQALRRALEALQASPLERREAPAGRANIIAAMKDELYDYQAVRDYLSAQPQAQTQVQPQPQPQPQPQEDER